MDEHLSRLKDQVEKIEGLKQAPRWGPEFQLWERATGKLVESIFGPEGLELFKQQGTSVFSYIDDDYNQRQYFAELDKRRTILEGLLAEAELKPMSESHAPSEKDILKKIWSQEAALKENLLTTEEAKNLHDALLAHLERALPSSSLPGLRFRKLKTNGRLTTWWSSGNYPTDNPWPKFEPLLELLAQHEAEKTIKRRLETEGLFVESRSQGEDQHLLIGKRDGTSQKAHIVIDGKTGEIRTKDNRQEPTELATKIETILTLPDGKRIRTTREVVEELKDSSTGM